MSEVKKVLSPIHQALKGIIDLNPHNDGQDRETQIEVGGIIIHYKFEKGELVRLTAETRVHYEKHSPRNLSGGISLGYN